MTVLDEIEAAIPALRRYAVALLRDRTAADDLVQDCLERALARRAGWRGEGSVRGWMFRILVNLHHDGQRQRPKGVQLTLVSEDMAEFSRPGAQEGHMALREVQAAIARLPEDQRKALLLVALEGMSLAEAAAVLGLAEGTLASRLGRARASLRAATGRKTEKAARPRDEGTVQP
ncbi:MAG: sigma-70 family RNA polymerase sigma factor [Rhodobacteraceae bacterium]|nr:sigma-70 family RNA polymerase sigma factor [Paracoccaceae bacterium]